MPAYLCHQEPSLLDFESCIVDSRPGAVLLERSALHPGGGGQVADTAQVIHESGRWQVTKITVEDGNYWHHLDEHVVLAGKLEVHIDRSRRISISQLHTTAHMLNALIYQEFRGALVTGAQIYADGTARLDFDLPNVDNNQLRALEPRVNELMRASLDVRTFYMSREEALSTPGLVRTLDAYPDTPDDNVRVVEICGLDRQVCGGTHVANTATCRPIRLTKIENKGRRNRRIRMAFAS